VTAPEIGRVTIAEALELTALVARKQPERYGRFAARWLRAYLEEHEKPSLEDVELLVSKLRSLATPKDHASALAILRRAARRD
jgi:NAD(P)H-dependent FMN reductase